MTKRAPAPTNHLETTAVDLNAIENPSRVRRELRELAVAHIRPVAGEAEAKGRVPDSVRTVLADVDGLPGADAFAGGADDPVTLCHAAESLAWGDAGIALAWLVGRQVAWVIAACGTVAQRDRYLPRLCAPIAAASLHLYEGFGRAPSEVETTATRVGDDWVIDGAKIAVLNPVDAGIGLVVARDAEDGSVRAFVIESTDGVTVHGAEERRVALGAVPMADVTIAGLRVPDAAALPAGGLLTALSVCRLAMASVSIGASEAATRYAARWGRQRVAFGRPLVGFQGVSFVLADLFMEIEDARLGIADAVAAAGDDPVGTEVMTSRVVAETNQLFRDAGREGVELLGVHGVIVDHPQERCFRSAAAVASIDFDPLLSPLVLR